MTDEYQMRQFFEPLKGTNLTSEMIRNEYARVFASIPSGFSQEEIKREQEERDGNIKIINDHMEKWQERNGNQWKILTAPALKTEE